MELSVYERIILLNVLPAEGSFVILKAIRCMVDKLGFSSEELKELNLKQAGEEFENADGVKEIVPAGQIRWKQSADKPKEIKLDDTEKDIIYKELKKLDEEGKLKRDHFDLYAKFFKE